MSVRCFLGINIFRPDIEYRFSRKEKRKLRSPGRSNARARNESRLGCVVYWYLNGSKFNGLFRVKDGLSEEHPKKGLRWVSARNFDSTLIYSLREVEEKYSLNRSMMTMHFSERTTSVPDIYRIRSSSLTDYPAYDDTLFCFYFLLDDRRSLSNRQVMQYSPSRPSTYF